MATTALKGNTVNTVGELPAVGAAAPSYDLVGEGLSSLTAADATGRTVLNIFPSVDTGICAASVRKFNELAAGLEHTTVINVSQDLPFAQARFFGAQGIENVKVGSPLPSSFGAVFGIPLAPCPPACLLRVARTSRGGSVCPYWFFPVAPRPLQKPT